MPSDNSDLSGSNQRSYRLTDDLASELNLRPGQIIRAVVVSSLDDSNRKVLLNLKGQRVIAETELDVDDFQPLIVKVESLSRPIELSLFDQNKASRELDVNEWSQFVEDMGLNTSDELLELIPELASEHIPLSEDVLREAQEFSDKLMHSDEGQKRNQIKAFSFLKKHQLPVSGEAIDILSSASVGGSRTEWPLSEGEAIQLRDGSQIRDVYRQIGFDYVNQIGKWPKRATRTVHSKLLDTYKSDESELNHNQLNSLSSILEIGLLNSNYEDELRLPLPPPGKGITVSGKIILECNEEGNFEWSVVGVFGLRNNNRVGIEINSESSEIELQLSANDGQILQLIDEEKSVLVNFLDNLAEKVTVTTTEEMLNLDATLFEDKNASRSSIEGVDFTV